MKPKYTGAKCDQCDLCNRPFVPPHIPNDEAQALVIGEAPGSQEIVKGIPFVGPSGQILNAVLSGATVAKTNAVLCRPINNGDPSKKALAACQGALDHVIQTVNPSKIIALGNTPLYALNQLGFEVPETGIMNARGKSYETPNRQAVVYPSLHPAYVLRNPNTIGTLRNDVTRALGDTSSHFNTAAVQFDVISDFSSLRAVLAGLEKNALVAFDVETYDLIWYDRPSAAKADFLCLVLALSPNRAIIVKPTLLRSRPDLWANFFSQVQLVAHNGKFDQEVLKSHFGIDVTLSYDTMLAHYILDENALHGLKALARDLLGCEDYKKRLVDDWFTANKIKKDDQRYGLLPEDHLYEYAAIDACVTYALAERFIAEQKQKKVFDWPYQEIINPLSNALTQVELTGIKIDRAWLSDVSGYLIDRINEIYRAMRDQFNDGVSFNPNSSQQISNIIYTKLGLKLTKQLIKPTKTNTGKEAIDALPDHPFLDLLKEYRRIEKMRNTYAVKLLELADIDDRIHINFKIIGTEVGRLSADDSLHGIPRADDIYGQMIRSTFMADTSKDRVLVVADYSQAELRVFAANSQEPRLLEAYKNGLDVHDQTAVMLEDCGAKFFKGYQHAKAQGNKDEVKRMRVVAKNCNFGGLCYQGGAQGISGMLGGKIPIDVLKTILAYFREVYPKAFTYADDQYAFARSHGYVKTRFNRFRRFPLITRDNADEVKKASVHMVTSSEAADLTNMSLTKLVTCYSVKPYYARIVHSIHDSLITECDRSVAKVVSSIKRSTMENMGNMYIPEVPWIVDVDEPNIYWVKRPKL